MAAGGLSISSQFRDFQGEDGVETVGLEGYRGLEIVYDSLLQRRDVRFFVDRLGSGFSGVLKVCTSMYALE